METNNLTVDNNLDRPVEGAKKHLWSFFLSITLTIIAFSAVGAGLFTSGIAVSLFLVAMASVQAIVQLAIWMHLGNRGHEFPLAFFLTGALFTIIIVLGCFLLIWW